MKTRVINNLMGTVIGVGVKHKEADLILNEVLDKLVDYAKRFSANDEASQLMKINKNAGAKAIEVDEDLFYLISKAKNFSIASNGSFNLAIGPLIKLWRIGFSDANVPTKEKIKEKLKLINPNKVVLNEHDRTVFLEEEGMEIDLGAVAKGYFADEIIKYFKEKNATSGFIDLGGNVAVFGDNPNNNYGIWNIGIQNPREKRNNFLLSLGIKNKSVVTSGIYERRLRIGEKEYHHIFDSNTGLPVANNIASITIVSEKSIDCELWTTCLFDKNIKTVLNWINQLPEIEGIVISKENNVYLSEGVKKYIN